MAQDTLTQAKELYSDARDAMRANHDRMREDLEFSNPADPQQWDAKMKQDRGVRPTLTLDQTNQYINQVVNDARQNTPAILTVPADSKGDPLVAERLNGMIRHIEYVSRAGIAYDTGIEHAARVGLGWLRVLPQVVNPKLGEQEIRIARIVDPLSAVLDPNSTEPDGSDAMYGFVETWMTERALMAKWPKAKLIDFGESNGWFTGKGARIAELMKVEETPDGERMVVIDMDGQQEAITAEEARMYPEITGQSPKVIREYQSTKRIVKWIKMTGAEILEETEFPSQWIGIIPVIGHELWVNGERVLCGMTRRMMDGQRFHNWQMSGLAESNLSQPKAPFLVPARAIKGHEQHWKGLNTGSPAFLPYNDFDAKNEAAPSITPPVRIDPPQFPIAYANGARLGSEEMQAAVGMYKSNLGMNSSSVSGRAKMQDKIEGDTANFHYIDNLRRSMEHLGRIIVDMIPQVYDTARRVRILGLDRTKTSFVNLDPAQKEAVLRTADGKIKSINPAIGTYDVRVKVGPAYGTQRQELVERLTAIAQGNPQLGMILAPLMVKMGDFPDADQVERVIMATLPPPVQAAYQAGEGADGEDGLPPQARMVIEQLQQRLQQAGEMGQQMAGQLQQAMSALEDKSQREQAELQLTAQKDQADIALRQASIEIDATNAETNRIKAETERLKVEADARNKRVETMMTLNSQADAASAADQAAADGAQVMSAIEQLAAMQQQTAAALAANQQTMQALAAQQEATAAFLENLARSVTAPKVVQVQRGPDGKIIGAVATSETTNESIQ